MKFKTILMDSLAVERAIKRIAHEIIENNKGVKNVALVGIAKGGIPICEKLKQCILDIEGASLPTAQIDITSYRDDISAEKKTSISQANNFGFSLEGKDVVLCDDVLFTGRTVRAGIEAIIKLGRPKSIQLAVLIDRGHRELPIRADYVGKNVPTSMHEIVCVQINEQENSVILCE